MATIFLSACSSTQSTNVFASNPELKEQVDKIDLTVGLRLKGQSVVIEPFAISRNENNVSWTSADYFTFNARTLYPAFDTKRRDCRVNTPECEALVAASGESPFLKINNFESDYGDTYSERVEQGKEPGLTGKDVAALTLASPFMVIPAMAAGSIFAIKGAADLATEGTVVPNKEAEFDHDSFVKLVSQSILKEYGSVESYINKMVSASQMKRELRAKRIKVVRQTRQNIESHQRLARKIGMHVPGFYSDCPYQVPVKGDIESAKSTALREHKVCLEKASQTYIAKVTAMVEAGKSNFVENQKQDFYALDSIYSARQFIKEYKYKDIGELVSKAKNKLDYLTSARQSEISRELEYFRDNLQVGDRTFCGRVINKRNGGMFEISVTAKLANYSNEVWIHRSEIFKPESGCYNRNGNISPRKNPYEI